MTITQAFKAVRSALAMGLPPLRAWAMFIVCTWMVYAQQAGIVTGRIYDSSGAAVSHADVTLVNQWTGDIRQTFSNDEGHFSFPSVAPATYALQVRVPNFKSWEQRELAVRPGDTRNLSKITLDVGAMQEQLTVEDTLEAAVDSGERSATLTARQIANLSLAGRDVTELLRVMPGMAVFNGGGIANGVGYSGLVVGFNNAIGSGYVPNGLPARGGTDLTSDGAHVIDPGCNCNGTQTINADMTAEVKLQSSNFGADQAKGPASVNAVGKSGSADYHGQAYVYGRDSALNSTDWLMNRLGQAKPRDRYLYPGGNLGGPVPHTGQKLLFWSGYEYYYQRLPPQTPLTSYVPTASMRKGDFSATAADNAAFCGTAKPWVMCPLGNELTGTLPDGSTVPANGIISPALFDKGGLALLKIIPQPNANPALTPGGVNYMLPYTTGQNGWIWRTRVDYNFSVNTKLYVSYNRQQEKDELPVHLWWQPSNSVPFPGGMSSNDRSHTVSAHLLQVAGPTLTNEVVGTFSYVNFPLAPDDPSQVSRSTLGYPYKGIYANGDPMLPSLSNGYWTPQPMLDQPDLFYPNGSFVWKKFAPTLEDNLSKVYRAHTLKFGFYSERTANHQGSWAYTNGEALFMPWGSYTNNTVLNMLLGRPSEFWENNFQAITNMSYRTYAMYAMDHWNVTRRLSLTLGVRFEHLTGWFDDDRKTGLAVWKPERFDSEAAAGVDFPGASWTARDSQVPWTGAPNRPLFASPRLGGAYDLFGSGNTVLRGGWGLYRWHDSWNEYGGALQSAQGSRQYHDYSGATLADLDHLRAGAAAAGGLPTQLFAVDSADDRWPLTTEYTLTVSQRLPWRSFLEIGYVGNHTVNQLLESDNDTLSLINVNLIRSGALFQPDPITGAAADPLNATLANYATYGTRCLARNAASGVCTSTAPGYGSNQVGITRHAGYSNYNALQTTWRRESGPVSFDLNYTFSKALGVHGTGQLGGSTADSFQVDNNYGILSHDRTHILNASYQFDLGQRAHGNPLLQALANGWTIAGITTLQSGPNMQSLYNANFSMAASLLDPGNPGQNLAEQGSQKISQLMLGTPNARVNPVYTCDPAQGLKQHQYVNPNCITMPAYQSIDGHLQAVNGPAMPGYYLRGPAFFNSDLTVHKQFRVAESHLLQVRASAFNFLNHPLPSFDPNNTTTLDLHFTEVSPGKWTQTNQDFGFAPIKLGRRVLQLALKYEF
ncbi:MAG: carboxypeptidase-like regulatory domain-containing protein [Candidatus Solibacter sp.]